MANASDENDNENHYHSVLSFCQSPWHDLLRERQARTLIHSKRRIDPQRSCMQLLSTRCIPALVIFLASVDAEAVGAGCASGKLSLQVKILGDSHVRLGKPVTLHVVVGNTGEDQLELPTPMEPRYYWLRFEARNEQGRVLAWRGAEPKLVYSEHERVVVGPGYSYGRFFDNFEENFDFSKPGKYAIRATWGIGPDGNCAWGKYTSREFKLRVIP